MAFRKVVTSRRYIKYNECEQGDLLAKGEFLGSEDGRYGVQHLIKGDDGVVTVLNSAGHLNWLLEAHASPNEFVEIYYDGMETLQKGPMKGKQAHRFDLRVDDGIEDSAEEELEEAPPPPTMKAKANPRPEFQRKRGRPAKAKPQAAQAPDVDFPDIEL